MTGEDQTKEKPVEKLVIKININDPKNKSSPFSSTSLDIRGDIIISYGDLILTKSDDDSQDYLNDAVVYVILELHRIVTQLFYTSISWRVEGRIGIRFIFNRYALLFYGGVCTLKPKITVMVYDSRRLNITPLLKIRVTPEEIAEAVLSATKDLLQDLITLENEVMKNKFESIFNDYLGAGDEMKRSPLYKELAFSNLKTEMILKEHRKIGELKRENKIFFNFRGGFSIQDDPDYEWI